MDMSPLDPDAPYESKDDPTTKPPLAAAPAIPLDTLTTAETESVFKEIKHVMVVMLLNTLVTSVCLVLGLEGVGGLVGFICLIVGTLVVGFLGAHGFYKWGTLDDEMGRLKASNATLESQTLKLRANKSKKERQVNVLRGRLKVLHRDLHELEQQLGYFNQIKDKLAQLEDSSGDARMLVKSTTSLINEMKDVAIENERAYLYELFFNMEFRDNESGLNPDEFKRLLARLPSDSRKMLTDGKTFEQIAGGDGVISMLEFQQLVSNYLQRVEQGILVRRQSTQQE